MRPDRFGFYDTQWRKWPGQGVVPASASELATPAVPPKSALPGVDEESFGPPSADGAEPAARGVNSADRPDSPRGKAPQPVPSVPAPVPQEPEAAEPVVPTPQPAPSVVPEPEATAPAPEPVPELPPAFPGIESPATDLPATDSPAETPPLPPVPEAPATPQPAPAAPEKSNDGDLFDEAAVGRARRVFIASRGGEGREAASAGVQQAIHRRGVARLQVEGRTTTATGNVPRVSFDPRAEAEQLRAGR